MFLIVFWLCAFLVYLYEKVIFGYEYNKEIYKKFPNLPRSSEIGERMAVLKHLNSSSKVLEVGANIGGVSSIIASILDDSKNLISIEPIQGTCDNLQKLGQNLKKPFNVFCGVLRGQNAEFLECHGKPNSYAKCHTLSKQSTKTENLTLNEIQTRYNINFNTIIIDCEGCYTSFINDILSNYTITQIQIEWDGPFLENQILNAGFVCTGIYKHADLSKGVRVYDRPQCFHT